MAKKAIKVTCAGSALVELDDLTEFQGGLKVRGVYEIGKLKASILEHGISFPVFIWRNGETNYTLDGHGRILALRELEKEGYKVPPIPVAEIEAKSEADAKLRLLKVNSQYGLMTVETVLEFMGDLKLDFDDLLLPTAERLDFIKSLEVPVGDAEEFIDPTEREVEERHCPQCGYTLGKKVKMTGRMAYFGDDNRR